MATEDDLRRVGQAATALFGVAAARARQVAEQLFGAQDKAREEAVKRAEPFVEEGRRAAAEAIAAMRREAQRLLRELEHLERSVRPSRGTRVPSQAAGPAARPSARAAKTVRATKPAKKAAAQAATRRRTPAGPARKTSSTAKAVGRKTGSPATGPRTGATKAAPVGAAKRTGATKTSPANAARPIKRAAKSKVALPRTASRSRAR